MPQNFPEVWLDRVIDNLDNSDQAPFLEGVSEISAPVTEINSGQMSEKNKIYVPETDFEVEVLVNNNSYPIEFQDFMDGTIEITLDKYQTKVVSLNDDDVIGASYDKIDKVTDMTVKGLTGNKYKRAVHSMAPQSDDAKTPVVEATGGEDGLTAPGGRKRMTYDDLVSLKESCDDADFGEDRRLVLTQKHWSDLLRDRKNFGDQLVNYKTGEPAPMIAGFNLYSYSTMPVYDTSGAKKAFGAIEEETDSRASVAFSLDGIAKKTGMTKQYFVEAANNPQRQSNDLAYRHYFVVTPYRNRKIGAILE